MSATPEQITPNVDDVALLLRTRTTGDGVAIGLGSDTGPDELTTFTDSTRPTDVEVEAIIQTAFSAVTGMFLGPVPDDYAGAAKHAISLYAAVLVETSFFREQAEDAAIDIWRELMAETVAQVNRAITELSPAAGSKGMGTIGIGSIVRPASDNASDPTPGIDF